MENPSTYDSRCYDYTAHPTNYRAEYALIMERVSRGDRVIDFGCGNGSLLKLLHDEKQCECVGLDISRSGVELAKDKGIDAHVVKIDFPLANYSDREFDVAICNVSLQMVMYPEITLSEMARVAKSQVIVFPNFGYFSYRMQLLFQGKFPAGYLYGYQWYSTGHIHPFSLSDLIDLARSLKLELVDSAPVVLPRANWKKLLTTKYPNLFSSMHLVRLTRGGTNVS